MFIESIRIDGLLSFAPGSPSIDLQPLNVLIGPNGAGKSNFLEAFSLLATLSSGSGFQDYLRFGGGPSAWFWKGQAQTKASVEIQVKRDSARCLRYRFALAATPSLDSAARFVEEEFSEDSGGGDTSETFFKIRDSDVDVATKYVGPDGPAAEYSLASSARSYFNDQLSLLNQRATPDSYPDTHWLGHELSRIVEFREWSFGREGPFRAPQRTDLPTDLLLHDGSNLAMMILELTHTGELEPVNSYLKRFLPRFERISARTSGGAVLTYLHESGFGEPFPAVRLSDGTLRFIAMLVTLLRSSPPPLVCIDEPELGLHPDALSLVAELLVAASARTQLIVTTHSDALVSALTEHIESVLVCEYLGGTQLRRLSADALSHWLDKYRLGDLWRMGELGGNP